MSPRSRVNLENGRKNGKGKPKDFKITATLRAMLEELCPERWLHVEDKGKGLTYREAIAKTILNGAVSGKPGIISELLDRLEGKVALPVGGVDGEAIHVVHEWVTVDADG